MTHFVTFFTKSFGHLIASLQSGQDFLYHKCVPQWSIFTGVLIILLILFALFVPAYPDSTQTNVSGSNTAIEGGYT